MINVLGMCCIFSVGFFFPFGDEKEGKQKDAETFHHCFLLIQHSFYKVQVPTKIPMPVYSSKKKKNVLLCLHDHTCIWGSSRTHICQSPGRNRPSLHSFRPVFLKHISFNRRARHRVGLWTYTPDLKLSEFCF